MRLVEGAIRRLRLVKGAIRRVRLVEGAIRRLRLVKGAIRRLRLVEDDGAGVLAFGHGSDIGGPDIAGAPAPLARNGPACRVAACMALLGVNGRSPVVTLAVAMLVTVTRAILPHHQPPPTDPWPASASCGSGFGDRVVSGCDADRASSRPVNHGHTPPALRPQGLAPRSSPAALTI
ncbi:hypothetical protein GCM10007301_21470 [Azorhizobium oxalatiphilum]|uniref:Uncharacterized protein n=1 Tax=Azorhizobium oxalatiphilum TaxID=980631 RepID=A0A917FAU0_9HYPH|nr:hypothetical protein GCM10007301_21470 [Azorhizobium oxalatiphilum]